MRVGIDATNWSNQRGYGRYARGLLRAMLGQPSHHEFILFVDRHTYENAPMPEEATYVLVDTREAPSQAASAGGRRSLRDLWRMSKAVAGQELDAFYFPSVYTYFPILNQTKVLLGVHDVTAEEYPQLIFPQITQRTLWRIKSWLARHQADYIVTVSEYSKAGIVRRFGWPAKRVWVVGEAPEPVFHKSEGKDTIRRALGDHGLNEGDPFLVCLGGLNPHKNLSMLFEVLAKLRRNERYADLKLLLIGPAKSDTFTPGARLARETVSALGLEESVIFTGFLPDEDTVNLLNAAKALVMPSFAEGYGLGAVEAAASGTPVVATKNSPLPDLLDGGGFFIDPHRPEELLAALEMMLGDEARRIEMGETAKRRASKLTWQRAAQQFYALLAHVEDKS